MLKIFDLCYAADVGFKRQVVNGGKKSKLGHPTCKLDGQFEWKEIAMQKLLSETADMALNVVDLDRYPIADITEGAGAAFLEKCQRHMKKFGWCNFDGFIRADALALMEDEANALLPSAETLTVKRTIYQQEADLSADEGDPKRETSVHIAQQLADDQIPVDTILQRLYKSPILTDFIRQVQMKPALYRCADEFQALNIVALAPGRRHAWHYDTTECTITLLLQAAEKGGEFAFIPNSRTDDYEDRDNVRKLIGGDLSVAQVFDRGAGTFTLFRGGYSLHGVTKVEGQRPRISAVMTYSEEPNTVLSDDVNIRIYGPRVAAILQARKSA